MYFPSDMTFQYFFFSTYPGYFLQAFIIALVVGIIYAVCKVIKTKQGAKGKSILRLLFICYITMLLCLTLFEGIMGDMYYYLFYHRASGRHHYWLTFTYNFIPDFFNHFNAENLGNILMYLPFGILYPLYRRASTWKRTLAAGVAVSVGIELLQPFLGRSFDINDIILNSLGVVVSTAVFFIIKAFAARRHGELSGKGERS